MITLRRWLDDGQKHSNRPLARLGTLVLLMALVAFHAFHNWRWLAANVTLLGWDVPSHLGTSFIYDGLLDPFTPKTLFASVVWHPNRPPLFFLSAIPLYRLFGLSADVGIMVNVLYLAVLFGSVYGIGRRLGGRGAGLLAAFVVATLPMIYAMSRTFYLELALAAMVSLSVYLLLASERFEDRTASLLFGLSFGLGLLTKRTYLVFMLAPLCLVAVRSNAWRLLKQRWQAGFHLDAKDALWSLGLGVALALIGRGLAIGDWLAVPGNSKEPRNGVVRLVTAQRDARVFFVKDATTSTKLELQGSFDDGDDDVLIVIADEESPRFTRSPKPRFGRDGKIGPARFSVASNVSDMDSVDDLYEAFRLAGGF